MINYNTNQWSIVKFPCGAGGKFLSNCLFLFDSVAHWGNIQGKQQTVDYFKQTILVENTSWLKRELNHQWGTNFFSRSYRRNNDLTTSEFNQLVTDNASEYFNQCWQQGLGIVDHWGKPNNPLFWSEAKKINIIVDDYESYKQLVMKKLFRVEKDKIVSLLDLPSEATTSDNIKYINQFKNQVEFPLTSINEFFSSHVEKLPWLAPWLDYQIPSNEIAIAFSQLIDYTQFSQQFEQLEDLYRESIPRNYLNELHNTWIYANEHYTS